jgi:hypothetical protein
MNNKAGKSQVSLRRSTSLCYNLAAFPVLLLFAIVLWTSAQLQGRFGCAAIKFRLR